MGPGPRFLEIGQLRLGTLEKREWFAGVRRQCRPVLFDDNQADPRRELSLAIRVSGSEEPGKVRAIKFYGWEIVRLKIRHKSRGLNPNHFSAVYTGHVARAIELHVDIDRLAIVHT
jgi:hypothetical protein